MLFLAASLWASSAHAATLDDVTMADTDTVGGHTVTLNGIGLREKFWLDIYIGGLYLEHTTHDGKTAIDTDEAKKMRMHFIYSKVTHDQLVGAWHDDFAENPAAAAQQADVDKFISWMPAGDTVAGDEIIYEYTPGTGTTVTVKGQVMGTIPGVDFMKLVWGVWLGDNPPTEEFKDGMLGSG